MLLCKLIGHKYKSFSVNQRPISFFACSRCGKILNRPKN